MVVWTQTSVVIPVNTIVGNSLLAQNQIEICGQNEPFPGLSMMVSPFWDRALE